MRPGGESEGLQKVRGSVCAEKAVHGFQKTSTKINSRFRFIFPDFLKYPRTVWVVREIGDTNRKTENCIFVVADPRRGADKHVLGRFFYSPWDAESGSRVVAAPGHC